MEPFKITNDIIKSIEESHKIAVKRLENVLGHSFIKSYENSSKCSICGIKITWVSNTWVYIEYKSRNSSGFMYNIHVDIPTCDEFRMQEALK